jgi:hypothetical protein
MSIANLKNTSCLSQLAVVSVLPTWIIVLVGCTIPLGLNLQGTVGTEFLDGNYQRLASCAYQRLGGSQAQLTKTDLPQRGRTVVASTVGSDKRWELAFINEDGGRQTKLEVTTASGPPPGEHILALVRACAA